MVVAAEELMLTVVYACVPEIAPMKPPALFSVRVVAGVTKLWLFRVSAPDANGRVVPPVTFRVLSAEEAIVVAPKLRSVTVAIVSAPAAAAPSVMVLTPPIDTPRTAAAAVAMGA